MVHKKAFGVVYTLISRTNPKHEADSAVQGLIACLIFSTIFQQAEQFPVFITRYSGKSYTCQTRDKRSSRRVLNETLVVSLGALVGAGAGEDIKVPRDQAQVGALVALSISKDLHARISVDVEQRTNPTLASQLGSPGSHLVSYPLGTLIRKSFCAPCTKLATLNQLVFFSSPLPNELPITYLTSVRSPEMVTSSGATPRRPTTVMRASCEAGEELKLRAKARGAAVRNVLANMFAIVWGLDRDIVGDGQR